MDQHENSPNPARRHLEADYVALTWRRHAKEHHRGIAAAQATCRPDHPCLVLRAEATRAAERILARDDHRLWANKSGSAFRDSTDLWLLDEMLAEDPATAVGGTDPTHYTPAAKVLCDREMEAMLKGRAVDASLYVFKAAVIFCDTCSHYDGVCPTHGQTFEEWATRVVAKFGGMAAATVQWWAFAISRAGHHEVRVRRQAIAARSLARQPLYDLHRHRRGHDHGMKQKATVTDGLQLVIVEHADEAPFSAEMQIALMEQMMAHCSPDDLGEACLGDEWPISEFTAKLGIEVGRSVEQRRQVLEDVECTILHLIAVAIEWDEAWVERNLIEPLERKIFERGVTLIAPVGEDDDELYRENPFDQFRRDVW